MKKILNLVLLILSITITTTVYAGFKMGMFKAVKQRTKELDTKVEEVKSEIKLSFTASLDQSEYNVGEAIILKVRLTNLGYKDISVSEFNIIASSLNFELQTLEEYTLDLGGQRITGFPDSVTLSPGEYIEYSFDVVNGVDEEFIYWTNYLGIEKYLVQNLGDYSIKALYNSRSSNSWRGQIESSVLNFSISN